MFAPKLRRSRRHIPEGFHFLLEGKPHPLLIPSIISEVVSYLDLSDLKTLRQVCLAWNHEASKKVRQVAKIVIDDEDKITQFIKFHKNTPNKQNYVSYEFKTALDLGSPNVSKFFESFGQDIEFMHFNRVRWAGSELKHILFNTLPNLHTLVVEARAYSDRRLFVDDKSETLAHIKVLKVNIFSFITELTTPLLKDLLRACPNVEQISSIKNDRNPLPMQFIQYVCQELSYDTADDALNMPYASDISIAEALVDSQEIQLPKLAILDCNMRVRGHGLLKMCRFPIKQLDLSLLSDVESYLLVDVLKHLEGTLQTLSIKYHPRCPSANDVQGIPPLKNLTNLTVNGYRNSLKFLEQLPKLQSLTLSRLNFTNAILYSKFTSDFKSKLQRLEVHEDFSRFCRSNVVNTVITVFPSVKHLKLESLTNSALRTIWERYRGLQSLNIMNGTYCDAGITGMTTFPNMMELDFTGNPSTNCAYDFDGGPSIRNLKGLRSLCISSPRITDASVLFGVVYCSNIRQLHLLSSSITDTSIYKILDKLDLFFLKTEHCYKLTKELVGHAKTVMRGRNVSLNEYKGPMKQREIPNFMRRYGGVTVCMKKIKLDESTVSTVAR